MAIITYVKATVGPDGTLILEQDDLRPRLLQWVGKQVEVVISPWTKRRSHAANNYYWGVVVESLADYTGYTKLEVHEILKHRFASYPYYLVNQQTGEYTETQVARSTSIMGVGEFAEYVQQCEELCAELGIRLPLFGGDRYEVFQEKWAA